jgi:hypothetical protein
MQGVMRQRRAGQGNLCQTKYSIAAIGVHELILDFRGKSIAHSIARLQRCAPEVIPLVGEQPCH